MSRRVTGNSWALSEYNSSLIFKPKEQSDQSDMEDIMDGIEGAGAYHEEQDCQNTEIMTPTRMTLGINPPLSRTMRIISDEAMLVR
jgi:hypothetical protein